MRIKKSLLWGILTIAIIIAAGFFLINSGNASTTGNVVNSGAVQVVKMYVQGSSYVFEPASVKVGQPVRIEADISRMPGCSKSIIIGEFGIRKTLTSSDNTISFTPDKSGNFYVACSMNMYRGTLTVLEADGTASNYLQPQTANVQTQTTGASGASCGGSGGCGCGGAA